MLKKLIKGSRWSSQLTNMVAFADDDVITALVENEESNLEFLRSCLEARAYQPILTAFSITESGRR